MIPLPLPAIWVSLQEFLVPETGVAWGWSFSPYQTNSWLKSSLSKVNTTYPEQPGNQQKEPNIVHICWQKKILRQIRKTIDIHYIFLHRGSTLMKYGWSLLLYWVLLNTKKFINPFASIYSGGFPELCWRCYNIYFKLIINKSLQLMACNMYNILLNHHPHFLKRGIKYLFFSF